jgi:hypothetical protein
MATCSVPGCGNQAAFEVFLYDVYLAVRKVFFRTDQTCRFLCPEHMVENEAAAEGMRGPRARMNYPYTNRSRAQGITIYRPLCEPSLAARRPSATTTVVEVSPEIAVASASSG